MTKTYRHISCEERAVIMINDRQGIKPAITARILGRQRSTITREINQQPKGQYCASKASELHQQRRSLSVKQPNLSSNKKLSDTVNTMIQQRKWSPEQISETLKLDYPNDARMHISHETIYRHICAIPKNELRKLFVSNLRQSKSKRGDVKQRVTSRLFKALIHKRFINDLKKSKPER